MRKTVGEKQRKEEKQYKEEKKRERKLLPQKLNVHELKLPFPS